MTRAWTVVAFAACGAPPLVDADGSSTTSAASDEASTQASAEVTPTSTSGTTQADETTASDEPCPEGEVRACFTGPPEAASRPPCRAGTQVCLYPGEWSPCWDEVLPAQQDCSTPEDETCSGAAAVCAGGQAWLRAFTTSSDAFLGGPIGASALAVAADGDIVATGLYGGTIEFGDQSIASIGELDVWVARFGPDGAPKWFRRFGGPDPTPNEDYAGAHWAAGNIAFDPDGDILVTTACVDAIDFGFGPLTGEPLDPVVLRMTSAGQPMWAHRYATSLYDGDHPLFVAPAGDGRVWLVGTVDGAGLDLGGGVLHSAGWGDVVLAQLDADGNHLWSRRAGDPGHQEVRAIAAAPAGGVVIAGNLEGSLDLGDGALTSAGTSDAFVARLDGEGEPLWARRYGDNLAQSSLSVRARSDGGVVLVGRFESTIDLGGGPVVPVGPGSTALFLAELAADGTHLWSSAMPGEDDPWVSSFDRGDDGTLVLAGSGEAQLLFPGDVWGSGSGAWVATLGPDGSPRWQHILTADSITYTWIQAAAGPDGAAIAAFTIYGEVDFDGVTVGVAERESLVLAQLGP